MVAAFSSPLQPRSPLVGGPWHPPNQLNAMYGHAPGGSAFAVDRYRYPSPTHFTPAWHHATPTQAAVSVKPASENQAPVGRYSDRVKLEATGDGPESVESPSTAVLAKRTLSGNVPSPVKGGDRVVVGSTTSGGGSLAYIESKISPVKSIKSSSPSKASPAKSGLLRV